MFVCVPQLSPHVVVGAATEWAGDHEVLDCCGRRLLPGVVGTALRKVLHCSKRVWVGKLFAWLPGLEGKLADSTLLQFLIGALDGFVHLFSNV